MVRKITATVLARNLSEVLDRLAIEREQIVIERNNREVARLLPSPSRLTALEAMSDLFRTLPASAAAGWERDSRAVSLRRTRLSKGARNPWDS